MDQLNQALENKFFYAFSVVFRLWIVIGFLYFFLVSLAVLGDGFKALGGKDSGSLFNSINNPIAGLMVGVLATVLVQSSSTTTSVVVTAVGSQVLSVQQGVPIIMGANIGTSVTNTIVSLGFANDHENYERAFSGATVHDMFNFLGVIVWLPTDIIINAINSNNGGLFALIAAAVFPDDIDETEDDDLFIKKAVADIGNRIIDTSSSVTRLYAFGPPETFCERTGLDVLDSPFSGNCGDSVIPIPSFSIGVVGEADVSYLGTAPKGKFDCACGSDLNLSFIDNPKPEVDIAFPLAPSGTVYAAYLSLKGSCKTKVDWDFCAIQDPESDINTPGTDDYYTDADTMMDFGLNKSEYAERQILHAQHFFDNARVVNGGDLFKNGYTDVEAGLIALVLAIVMICLCLIGIVQTMRSILAGPAEKYVVAGLNYNFPGGGYLAILVGAGLTLLVQSSSITTSILTPMVAIGTLSLENMFPFTIGANLGTTATGLIAGFAGGDKDGVQIALCHFFFNLFNALLWYPVPKMRQVPINAAMFLGTMAAAFRLFPVIYILIVFITYPFFFLALSILLDSSAAGQIAGGVILLLMFLGSHGFFLYWYHRMEGKVKIRENVEARAEANKQKKADALELAGKKPEEAI